MRISVALATYEGERYVRQQLDSIAAQTRLPDELVVGDDRSVDATAAVIEDFVRESPFPVAVRVNDRRLGTARNFEAVIRRCTGEVIALADQDDLWAPAKLELIERALSASSATGLVFSDCELIDEFSRSLGITGWESVRLTARDRNAIDRGDAFRTLVERQHRIGGTVTGATLAFRARYSALILPFPELLPESGKGMLHDAWITLLISAVAPVESLPALLVEHRQHQDQQIGMRPDAIAIRPRWRARPGGGVEGARRWLRVLRGRLDAVAQGPRRDAALTVLDGWLRHLDARATLPSGRLPRLAPVARELVSGRYHAYSSGLRSAAADLTR